MKRTILCYGIVPVFFLIIASSAFSQQSFYVNDNSTSGDVFTSAIGSNSNAGTANSPFATINRAISQAQPGDIIWIDAGTYSGQVFLDKGITLRGAGAGATIINAGTAAPEVLPNLPVAVIYSASGIGEVFIKNLTVNSGSFSSAGFYYGISLQTGGEISNCEINGTLTGSNAGNGIHVNKEDIDAEAIAILNNHLHHIAFIAIKFNVPHITATINNNTIDVTGSGYGMGLVGGGEPHLIDGLVFTGNKLIGLTGYGVKVHCNNSNVTISNNSFEEGVNAFTTTPFIQNYSSNTVNASCNWLGSADFETIKPRIQGPNIGYGPWLTNGADNSGDVGFQPLAGVCNGRQNKFFVNDASGTGDAFTTATGNNSNNGTSTAPFATINYAITQAQPGDTIYVDAGLYAEDIVVNKAITIKGVKAGVNPGISLSRGAESIIVPATDDPVFGTIVNLLVSDIVFDGFTIDGDNPSINGSLILNGADINKGMGLASFIDNTIAHNNLVIKNNIIRNVHRYGVFMQSTNTLPLSGNLITQNHFDNISATTGRQGRAVGLANNGYASVVQNIFTKVHTAIWINGGFNAPSQTACSITGNLIKSYLIGISVGGFSGAASAYLINNNSVTIEDLAGWNVPGASIENFNTGIFINNVTSTTGMSISNNTITNTYEGLALGRFSSPNWVVSGNTISGSKEIGLYYFNNSATNPLIHFQNNTLVDNDTAIYIHSLGGGAMPVTFSNNSVTGGNIGLGLDGSQISLAGNVLTGVSFTGLSGNYIQLIRNALNGQTIDASTTSFENKVAGDMTLAELFAVENKIAHRLDYNGVGFIKVKPHHAFVTTTSFSSTLPLVWGTPTATPDINRAVTAAAEGDSLYVAAGTYANQVTIDRGLTLIGEGKDATLLAPPSLPYSPPTGPFTEMGLIQTTQNIGDVHIRDLSVTGDHLNGLQGIMIQSGGSVKNCNIQNGNQGIFFRVESATKTAVVENNVISAEYIALNFQGSALTASMINNSITVLNPGFSAGVFVGLDFGPLPQFNATGNSITGFTYGGIFGGSSNGIISQNSIVGSGPAIWQVSGGLLQANCNWFGTSNAELIAPKISGNVSYTPWLSNGTDNSSDMGFQPMENVCGGRQNRFYVNDNNQTGDVFTTAIGNNSNNGFSSAPFATLDYAYGVAQAGDTILVDAGTYATPNLNINKSVTILGTNYNASPNNPADRLAINPVRNTEALITSSTFTIASNDVRLEGLSFNPGAKSQVVMANTGVNNFTFKRNNSIITFGTLLSLVGPSSTPVGQPSAFGNYLIEDNRFESQSTSNCTGVTMAAINDVTVNNNTFITSASTTQRVFIHSQVLNGGLTANYTYTNNISFASRADLFSTALPSSATFDNNITIQCFRSILLQGNIFVSTDIKIRNNYIETDFADGTVSPIHYTVSGTTLPGAIATALIENNTVIQGPGGRSFVPTAILARLSGNIENSLTTIRKNKISFTGNYSSFINSNVFGIGLFGKLQTVNVEENEIAFTGTNLTNAIPSTDLSASGISISSDFGPTNPLASNAVMNITGNKISGFRNSIAVYDATNLAPNTYVGYGNLPAGVVVNINNNRFTADVISINNGNVGQGVIATCNWYGSAAEQDVSGKVTSTVQYNPWLTNGTDNDAATGFQPLPDICNGRQTNFYVNDNSQTGDVFTTAVGSNSNNGLSSAPFSTLEYAYGIAQAGDTIYVDAGTYITPNITLSKSIAIFGANYQVSPNSIADPLVYNSARNAESIVSNSQITFAADNINIEGLTFNTPAFNPFVLSSTAVTNNLCNNIKLEKNRFISTNSASNVMVFNGKAVSPATTNNFLIHDNRMENATAAYMRIDNFNNFTITKNTFIRTVVPTNAIAIRQNTGRIENLIVEENVFQYWDATVFTGVAAVKNFVYNNNKAYHTLRGVQFNAGPTEPISLTITDNLFQQHPTAGTSPSLFINRNSALNAATPNSINIEANTFTYEGAGHATIPAALVNVICNNNSTSGDPLSSNYQLTFRKNIMSYTGNLSGSSNPNPHGLRFEGKLVVASIDNNEIAYTGINLPDASAAEILRSSGIFIGNATATPSGAVLNINNNKIHGFKQSIAFYNGAVYGGISSGVIANIDNNSFTGDLISINNGATSTTVNATCNWYGAVVAQDVLAKITTATVNSAPWLTNGADNDGATGFQPVSGACNGTPVVTTLNAATNISCFGANNGAITINISGGTTPYAIEWSKDGDPYSTNEDLTGLAPGTYSLIITDASGSVASIADIVISEPLLLTASASGSNVNCFGGSNGSALVVAEGGTAPYSYLWSNGAMTDDISNLPAGNYTVTITDANGCTVSAGYQVTQPTLLTATATPTSTSCFNSISVVANGGTAPYTYLWSNGATTTTISSIAAGTYSVVVTDANGCIANAIATVTANEAFNPSASATNVSCFGGANGSITVTNVNAVAPFQFSIDGGLHYQPGATFDGLVAGTYTITVKDANGCTGFVTKTIAQPAELIASLIGTQSTCYGQSSGSINVNTAGGTPGYTYSWTGPNGYVSSQKNISGLAVGNYNFTITDSRGCSASLSNITVSSSYQIIADSIVTNISCKGETNGSISLSPAANLNSEFTYLWNTGAVTASISNLGTGNYSVTITDISTGCSIIRSFTITQPTTNVNLSVAKTNATGCASLGSITATGSGGTAGYQYRLNGGAYQSSGSFTGLYAGSYTVWVRDQNGCTKSAVVSITDNGGDEYEGNNSKNQAKAINTNTDVFARLAIANDAADWFKFTPAVSGNYILSVTHPSASFTFNLYATGNNTPALVPTTTTATTKQYSLVANNTYYINITGGLSYECYTLNVAAPSFLTRSSLQEQPVKEETEKMFDVKVLGNPSQNQFNIVINSSSDEKIKIRVVDVSGRVVDVKENLQAGQSIRIGEKYRSGAYFAEVRQGNKTKTVRLIKL